MDISGKIVILTGASAGIGLSTARLFSAKGAKVALVARSSGVLQALAEEFRQQGKEAFVRPTDMRDPKEIRAMVREAHQHFGQIDMLINNAGQAVAGTVEELDHELFQRILELNVWGPLHAMQAVIPLMRKAGGGLIMNVSSMVTKMFLPGLGGYAASKAALNLISGTARAELAPDNIRVVTMFPRMTSTDFGKNSLGNSQLRQRQRDSGARPTMVVDTADQVAEKILEAAIQEPAEQYMEEGAAQGWR
jgi:short-subunit dehydrogenase